MGWAPVPDLVQPDLRVLFCGINPGRRSAEVGRHFAGASNRFWKVLHLSGLTPELVNAMEQERLLDWGLGITNLVTRSTAKADELEADELRDGAVRLRRLAGRIRPATVAVLGVQAYRVAFRRPRATVGPQPESLGPSAVWMLPNPSGLQAHYSLEQMVALYRQLGEAAGTVSLEHSRHSGRGSRSGGDRS